ncbi:MAG: hypothetical protein QME49_05875 [bacterium]|nr:hypothetical protein [bacterium]
MSFAYFSDSAKKAIKSIIQVSKQTIDARNIPIPRLILTPHYRELIIEDFNLDATKLTIYVSGTSILEARLQGSHTKDLFGNIHQGVRQTEITHVRLCKNSVSQGLPCNIK